MRPSTVLHELINWVTVCFDRNSRMQGIPTFLSAIALIVGFASCEQLVEVDPPKNNLTSENVFSTDATASAVLTGIYADLSRRFITQGNPKGMSLLAGLAADELTLWYTSNNDLLLYYQNQLTSLISSSVDFWGGTYPIIFVANSAIEGLTNTTALTPRVKQQLLGEAKFVRAFCYFYLVNLYGDIPLALTTDWKVNSALPRTAQGQVYAQIIADLKDAQSLLSDNYVAGDAMTSTPERVRPNKGAATALLARTYLYAKDYANAEIQSTAVITNGLYSLTSLSGAFLKNSSEAIWQLQPVGSGARANTTEGQVFILPTTGPSVTNPVHLSNSFVGSFEVGDQRRALWRDSVVVSGTTYHYPAKYRIGGVPAAVTEYSMVLRLAEQYLIRAEARAQLGNLAGAAADLDMIRNRAGLPNTTSTTQPGLLTAIQQERRIELFTEWGHRWLDLKRTNTADAVMSVVTPQKGGSWETADQLFPIRLLELQRNPKLVQNPGY